MSFMRLPLEFNPYGFPSPYQPGQEIPTFDRNQMMGINNLQRLSGLYVSKRMLNLGKSYSGLMCSSSVTITLSYHVHILKYQIAYIVMW